MWSLRFELGPRVIDPLTRLNQTFKGKPKQNPDLIHADYVFPDENNSLTVNPFPNYGDAGQGNCGETKSTLCLGFPYKERRFRCKLSPPPNIHLSHSLI